MMNRLSFFTSAAAAGLVATALPLAALAEPNSLTGVWQCTATGEGNSGNNTGHFTMSLAQSGPLVIGTYYNGTATLSGHLSGNDLVGKWDESGSMGDFHFAFAPNGRSFTGSWGTGGHTQGQWSGTKIE